MSNESKKLTYFRFAIREGQRIKIPVGKVIFRENDEELPSGWKVKPSKRTDQKKGHTFDLTDPDGEWVGTYPSEYAAINKAKLVQGAKGKGTVVSE